MKDEFHPAVSPDNPICGSFPSKYAAFALRRFMVWMLDNHSTFKLPCLLLNGFSLFLEQNSKFLTGPLRPTMI